MEDREWTVDETNAALREIFANVAKLDAIRQGASEGIKVISPEADAPDAKTDSPKKLPTSERVLKAIHFINDYRRRVARTGGIQPPQNAIISEHLGKPVSSKAVKNLDRQVRNYRHCLLPITGLSPDE